MRDPHVVSLTYKITSPEKVRYDNAPPVIFETAEMKLSLANGLLTVEPKHHFSSVDSAREVIDPFLRSWEVDVALRSGIIEITFSYQEAKLVDRDPPPPGSNQIIKVGSATIVTTANNITLTVSRGEYPEPPILFVASPDVETLWQRHKGYQDGREPLLSMAYFCLTLLESKAGNRRAAATTFKISIDVLGKLGELTSERGDARTARKFGRKAVRIPLTATESNWVQEAIKILIRRVGESSHVATLPLITMADLPPL